MIVKTIMNSFIKAFNLWNAGTSIAADCIIGYFIIVKYESSIRWDKYLGFMRTE